MPFMTLHRPTELHRSAWYVRQVVLKSLKCTQFTHQTQLEGGSDVLQKIFESHHFQSGDHCNSIDGSPFHDTLYGWIVFEELCEAQAIWGSISRSARTSGKLAALSTATIIAFKVTKRRGNETFSKLAYSGETELTLEGMHGAAKDASVAVASVSCCLRICRSRDLETPRLVCNGWHY